MENDLTPETLPEEVNVASAGGETGTVEAGKTAENLTLEELNTTLGKNFTTKEGALKAMKDTFAYVGKKSEPMTSKEELQKLRTDMFFMQNNEYQQARPILEALSKANNISLEEASNMDVFKDTFAKIKSASEDTKPTVMPTTGHSIPPSDYGKRIQEARGNKEKMTDLVIEKFMK